MGGTGEGRTAGAGGSRTGLRVSPRGPRTRDMVGSQAEIDMKRQVADDLHEEARKAFERGERELA